MTTNRVLSRTSSGFTIIELLVILALIGILIALLIPAVQKVREVARQSMCSNNIRQISIAMQNYVDSAGCFPCTNGAQTGWGILPKILPQIDQSALYNQINFSIGINCSNPDNLPILQATIPVFYCPSDHFPTLLTGRLAPSPCPGGAIAQTGDGIGGGCVNCFTARVTHYLGSFGDGCIAGENLGFTNNGDMSYTRYSCGGCSNGPLNCTGSVTSQSAQCVSPSRGFGGGRHHRGMFQYDFSANAKVVRVADITDGLTNTILLGHTAGIAMGCDNVWASATGNINGTSLPINFNIVESMRAGRFECSGCPGFPAECSKPWRGRGFQSHHSGGSVFAFSDGSVRYLTEHIDMRVYNAMGSRAGTESY